MILLSIFLLIIYSSYQTSQDYFNKSINRITIILLIYIIYMIIDIIPILYYNNSVISIYNDIYRINILSITISLLILLLSIILLFNSITSMGNIRNIANINYKYVTLSPLLLFNILGLILLMIVNNLIALYITIELQSYSLYIITSLYHKSNNTIKSGLMYFLYGGLASILILYGNSIIYYITGNLNMYYSYILIDYNILLILGWLLIIIGFTIKMGLAPLHNWSITIYANTPTIITTWISIVAKISIMTLLYNIVSQLYIYQYNYILEYILSTIIILSLIFGSIGGLIQIKIKPYLTYSGILNGGYMLFTILINNINSIIAYIIYIIQYSLTHINIFLIILYLPIIIQKFNINNNNKNNYIKTSIYSPIEYIIQLKDMLKYNPYLNLSLIICILSLIGIPPLYGFYGKLLILISSIANNYIYMSILLIIASTISAIYYLYIINITTINYKYNNKNNNLENYNNNNYNHSSISYIISAITMILALNFIQYTNILKGIYMIGILFYTI